MSDDANELPGNELPLTPVAAPVVPAPAPAPAPKGDDGKGAFEYEEVPDDPGLNMALAFIGKLGMGPDHPAVQEAVKGNFDFLAAHLAALGPKAVGYEHIVKLAKASFDRQVSQTADRASQAREAILEVTGGEEQWKEIQKWAGENAEPSEKAAINRMLNAGGIESKMAAEFLRNRYSESQGAVIEPKQAVGNVPANGASGAAGALSPAQYQQEMGKLVRQFGATGAGRQPEYKALQSRLAAYRG